MSADHGNNDIVNNSDNFFDWVECSALLVQDYFGSNPEASVDEACVKLLEKEPRLATMEAWGEKDIKNVIIEIQSEYNDDNEQN